MDAVQRKVPLQQYIVILVGGLVFLSAGLGVVYLFARDVFYGYWRTRDEVRVPAQIERIEVSKSGKGKDIFYRYNFQGRSYTGKNVSLFMQSEELRSGLHKAFQSNRPISVFIDPYEPSYSVIDREFSWFPTILILALFGLPFTFFGIVMVVQVFRPSAMAKTAEATAQMRAAERGWVEAEKAEAGVEELRSNSPALFIGVGLAVVIIASAQLLESHVGKSVSEFLFLIGFSMPFLSTALYSLRTGYAWGNSRPGNRGTSRRKSPVRFWANIVTQLAIASFLLAIGIERLLSH